ncbi:PREDICTED: oncostatin-M-specific receptor subunit beta isoform X1 [Pseudopodoces humilis]|uniref:oncostatin-M-specific receptor subunit beta isoform X1 n=1 Tax=Pseudopodoces humilis TaxID=181119 RepID=UPI0003959858|nr:PREDICTED: oncostatin-M-specific receptor subunit beta isoform X1 [Pseudopodoces humilis]XP_014112419.1 PREDICTED: oncostatin-M-specific receptor subunit beta isoform X1 [Pseudopodoces humilis]XP_014112420.1 PREDICTED: oncostatin-M-specific receptor subunit beta isoform X1 [Pseudopodoces humilis]XP_014112421.1 PREDICTED: oncostatin-M-specific receptor subunit beta isoform X1 [Pseudopodoces humilis]
MMNHFMILALLLPLRTCYTTYSQQESNVFPVTYLNVSKDLDLQRLLVEWDVVKSAHDAELAISFEIQVRRLDEATMVWTEFHNVTLDKLGKPLHWSWDSDIPLECMSHAVRIRSKAKSSKIWSQWSLWETVPGLDTSNRSGPQIFPKEKFLAEGSDITLCCIGGKGQTIKEFSVYPTVDVFKYTNSQVRLLTVENLSHDKGSNIHVYCYDEDERLYQAAFFVGKPPDTPKDFYCQTQDMKKVTCTWTEGETYLYGQNLPRYTLSKTSSRKTPLCKASCSKQCSCSWDIGQQWIWNVTVTVENPLGKKTVADVFDVNHRIYPTAPFQVWEDCTDTEITLHWNYENYEIDLFCQTEVLQPDGKVELHNSSEVDSKRVTVRGLQPYTEYTARVRCGAAKHFWRWSEWSQPLTTRTKEGTPSGKLDIWREITPVLGGRNVTLFWKQTPSFQANGKIISYEVTWEKIEDGSKPESISFSSVYNSTRIFIDNHSYRISIMAKNNVNFSFPSVLIISRATDNSTKKLKEGQVNGTDDGIFISWEPRSIYDSYIIDWCNFPKLQPCDLLWKRFGPNTSSAVISSAAFVPGVRYKFRIYGSVANRASLLEKKIGYLRELPPRLDPIVRKVDLSYNSVTLSWDSYLTNESEPGFVRGYNVYVSPVEGNCNLKGSKKHILSDESELCKYTIENPEEKRYTVKHLMPNTKYKIVVKAFTGGGETPIVNFRYIDTPYNSNMLYFVAVLVIVPALVAAICHWKMKRVKECCCPVIPSPSKSKVLSFKDFKIDSEKVLKINDCLPDMLAIDSNAEAQKLHPVTWSPLSSTPTEDKIDGHISSWIYPSENVVRNFPPTATPQTHTCFENFAYSSPLKTESDPYQISKTLEAGKTNQAVVLYQPQCYLDIFHEDAASTTRETAERKNSLKYISRTDARCLGGSL